MKRDQQKTTTTERMGRKKIDLKRIECSKERSDKYSKRKNGLLKKAQEIEVLCNIDIALIIFSPKNKANIYHSGSFGKILEKFCKVSLQEREDRFDRSRFYVIF
ncbi:hypothetical protein CARUB_v10024652mg [Capsella rubella]|uniref:MADS-box domain-containing protein n=1 Tax=Capsella rubella TaxID=81985 RepID=R0HFL4_9BRAS|nr:hypothetical protein CARUB_v10024652mg [Capsella rubella]